MLDTRAEFDEEAVETVVEELGSSTPGVLAMYLPGIDLSAHHAEQGPDAARRGYLREVIDRLRVSRGSFHLSRAWASV